MGAGTALALWSGVSAAHLDPDSPARGCPGKGSRAAAIYGGEPPPDEEGEAIAYGSGDPAGEPVPVGFRDDTEPLLGIDLASLRAG